MKENKKNINIFIIILISVSMISGIVCINIINTKALSPIGNTNENYELVRKEFGEDFSKFIKDNSLLKIYNEHSDILIRIGENNFRITNRLKFIHENKSNQK